MTDSALNTPAHPRAIVLLAAGQGSRMRPLTASRPKSLLEMDNRTILETILDPILTTGPREIVVVTGFEHAQMAAFLAEKYGDHAIRTVENKEYLQDTNILSAHIGVRSLKNPEAGYFIVETDIIAAPTVWRSIVDQEKHRDSFWVTRGVYGPKLTGGIVNVDDRQAITEIRYEPIYDPKFDGWLKMVGVLGVGPNQVTDDIETRAVLVAQSTAQYYMAPWIAYPERLLCRAFDLGDEFAISFNTQSEYDLARKAFAAMIEEAQR